MSREICIAVGNHKSLVGINEIIYCLHSCLSEYFAIKLTTSLKPGAVNIVIDEFSSLVDLAAMAKTKELNPNTRIVIVATEFIMPVSILGVKLTTTFNFFGGLRDWRVLLAGTARSLISGMPSYMHQRYLGFVRALKSCDLLAVVHPQIGPAVARLAEQQATRLPPPLMIYPQIGSISTVQQKRLAELPVGFTMTGTQTRYRRMIAQKLMRRLRRTGWFSPVYKALSFEAPSAVALPSSDPEDNDAKSPISYLHAQYRSIAPNYLFNINPPQTAKWPFSSPMRILRAIMLGQIPMITKKFNDHLIEDAAMFWDEKSETAVEWGMQQFLDRRPWLNKYLRSIEAYDRLAREANKPFISAITALIEGADVSNAGAMSEPETVRTLSLAEGRR